MEQDKLTGWKLTATWIVAIILGWCVVWGIAEGFVYLMR